MTPEQLLKPRFKVIADYPNSPFELNEIIKDGEGVFMMVSAYKPEKYPHLFKKLKWWEDREVEELPKFIQTRKYPVRFFEVKEYKLKDFSPFATTTESGDAFYLIEHLPATEQEYLNFKK